MANEYTLKDRHGKERIFDKETFYVRGTDGELMPFTYGTGKGVVEPLSVTENGTFTPPEGVDGYSPVTVAVPAPEVKLQNKAVTENGQYTADAGYDGLGRVEVNIPDPVVETLEITENGIYTSPDGVDGYHQVTVNVDPTRITVMREQVVSGFSLDANFGYAATDLAPSYALTEDETYYVMWDGVTYETKARPADSFMEGAIYLGNGSLLELPGNGEPFAIGCDPDGAIIYMAFTDASEYHTIGIYQKVTMASDDVRYVTFMSYDGAVEYGKKAVAVGDDCADPITRGVFDTPTRESDAQYTYTFYGWANEPNGGADASWNKAVTEDRTVYANFASAVRYYTITYYDDNGVTVLKTESLAYGATPVYEASKEGFSFVAWEPAVSLVTGDASYTAQWKALTGLSFLSKATLTEDAYRFAVANDGKHIAAMLDSNLSYVMCYTTTSETATASKLTTSHTGTNNSIDINYDGTMVRVTKGASSSSRYVDTVGFNGSTSSVSAGNATYIACSPTSNLYCYRLYANSKYSIKFSDGGSVALSASTSDMRITHGDKYLVCVQSKNIVVIDISAKSIVRTIATGLAGSIASFDVSEDGTKCLVATYSEEVVVYSLETFEKICDMSGSFSESTYAQFAGDMIVVGSGSTIRAFTIVDSAPVESFDIPAYSGGSVARMMSSHNKKYLGISDGSSIELWGNA